MGLLTAADCPGGGTVTADGLRCQYHDSPWGSIALYALGLAGFVGAGVLVWRMAK